MFEVVREILDNNPAGLNPKQIAAEMDMGISNIEKWGEDPAFSGSRIPSKHIRDFTRITKDIRLANWFKEIEGLDAVGTDGSLMDQVLNLNIMNGDFSERLKNAMENDNKIDYMESKALLEVLNMFRSEIDLAERELKLNLKEQGIDIDHLKEE